MKAILALIALVAPLPAFAANDVALTSEVFLEKTLPDASGRGRIVLEAPRIVVPGDKLVFVLAYRNMGRTPAADFIVTNPMPEAVAYQGGVDATAAMSVDGGKTWGPLASLKIRRTDGTMRAASPEDVTHVRWVMKQPIPVGATGKLSFRGVVK